MLIKELWLYYKGIFVHGVFVNRVGVADSRSALTSRRFTQECQQNFGIYLFIYYCVCVNVHINKYKYACKNTCLCD